MAKKKTTKPKVSSSTAKKLSGILKSVGVNVSASKIQSIVAKSGGSSSNKNVASTPATKPFNIMDYVTPGKEAEAQAIINKGSGGGSTTAPGAGMSQTQFVDYLVNQGIVTDKNKAYQTLGLKIDETNPFIAEGMPANFNTWPSEVQAEYLSAVNAQTKAIESGKVVNPNIELTPEVLKKFKDQAMTELDPVYKEKFSLLDNEFNTSISRLMDEYNKQMGRVDTTFKQTLGTQAEGEAASGTAFSSGRKQRQERTIDLQNQTLADTELAAQQAAQDTATAYEKLAGSDKLRTLNIPGLTQYRASGTGVTSAGTRSLYNPLGNIALGEYNQQKEKELGLRSAELEKDYRANRELNLSTY